jgi:multiple antibiotic resistance protein
MHDAIKVFFLIFGALFPIVDPLSSSPIFLELTRNLSPEHRKKLSRRITLNSFVLMVASYFLGAHVLKFFGVSLPAVQVGGGLVVCALGWALLMQKDGDRNAKPDAVQSQNIFHRAFYPLTLPLTIGPGSISVTITVGANITHNYGIHVSILLAALLAMALIAGTIFLCYGFADWLGRVLGETGTMIVIRLAAFLLLCIGVQIVWNGLDALLESVQLQVR